MAACTVCITDTAIIQMYHLYLSSVHDLGKLVKDAVQKQGMLGWQYNTIGVSDAITMGGEGTNFPRRFGSKLRRFRYAVLTTNS